jgi:hypothetical protein
MAIQVQENLGKLAGEGVKWWASIQEAPLSLG